MQILYSTVHVSDKLPMRLTEHLVRATTLIPIEMSGVVMALPSPTLCNLRDSHRRISVESGKELDLITRLEALYLCL